jgi:hypothetical protein
MFAKRQISLFAILIAAILLSVGVWALTLHDPAPAQAGGGEATMNQMFTQLLVQNNYTVTLQLTAPINGQTQIVLTSGGANGTYSFARNGADHLCVKGPTPDAPTDCIPFSNIASFSYPGTLQ